MTDQDNDKIMQAARQLATEVSPSRDLWPEIAAEISTPAPRRQSHWFAQAAAVVLLVAGSSGITYYAMQGKESGGPSVVTTDMIFEQTSFGNRYHLGPGFQDARDSLVSELEAELEKLSPADRATIETNLVLIHDAIAEMNDALEQEPDNVLLQQQLLNAYQDELDLLRRVGGLTRNVMLRNDI